MGPGAGARTGRRELVSEIETLTKEFENMIDTEANQPVCADPAGRGAAIGGDDILQCL